MPDPVTTLGLGAVAAYLGKDGIEKLLGPTADYLGKGIQDFTRKRVENIGKIFQKAESTLGSKLDAPGMVPPKVLKCVLDDGSFANDQLAVEYLGGILASSRTELGRDDRGARMAKMVDSLSSYQLRTHFLIYSTVRALFAGKGLSMNMDGRPRMEVFLPFSGYAAAMEFSASEYTQIDGLFSHIFFGLSSDELIESSGWQYGGHNAMKARFSGATESGVILRPSSLGAELFLWAFGHADKPLDYIFSPQLSSMLEGLPSAIHGACPTQA